MTDLPTALYTAAQVRELDRRAIEDFAIPGYELMQRAGRAAFGVLRARWPAARRITVLCGTGNNGGDGYVLARLALEAGLQAEVIQLGEPGRIRGDALRAREAYLAAGGRVQGDTGRLPEAEVLVDALLGTGLERTVEGRWRAAIEALNAHPAPVLAVDIPSGLHADTGAVLGAAVQAAATVTFIGLKRGLFTGRAPALVGELVFDDLQVPAEVHAGVPAAARRLVLAELQQALAPRRRDDHKGRFGHVLVVGGDLGMAGAVRMAAEAAARCGAGLTSVATRREHVAAVVGPRPELMCRGVDAPAELDALMARASVIAIGPGLGRGPWGRGLLERVLEADLPLVVDADALNLLAAEPLRREDWVLTPHPGEAARLLGCPVAEVQADRYGAAAELARRYGGVCVLKGAGSLVADGQGLAVCTAGNPGMASGGMGDVLTGILAGLRAQGLEAGPAARLGVCLHAAAADRAAAEGGERGLLAGDLFPHLRPLVNP